MPDEFWQLTPAEHSALIDAYQTKVNIEQMSTAYLTAMVAGMFGGDKQHDASDFLPFRPPRRALTIEESEFALKQIAQRMGAEIHTRGE